MIIAEVAEYVRINLPDGDEYFVEDIDYRDGVCATAERYGRHVLTHIARQHGVETAVQTHAAWPTRVIFRALKKIPNDQR